MGKSVNVTFLKKHKFRIGVCLDMICIQGSLMFVQIAHTKPRPLGSETWVNVPEVASLFENLYMYANLIYVDIHSGMQCMCTDAYHI